MNIEKLYGDLQSQTNLTAPELSKVMASAKSPGDLVNKIAGADPSNFSGALDAFKGIPGGDLDPKLSQDFLKGKGTEALGGLQDKFSGALSDAQPKIAQMTAKLESGELQNKAAEIMRDPETQKKISEGLSQIQNMEKFKGLQSKLSGKFEEGIKNIQFNNGQFDQLQEIFDNNGIELDVGEMATQAQTQLDQFQKEGGIQKIGDLSSKQLNGLTTQMGKNFSNFDADRFSKQIGDGLGKYNMDPAMMENAGFLKGGLGAKFKAGALSSSDIFNNPASWAGGTKPGSKAGFLGNPIAQENGFKSGLNNVFNKFKSSGVIAQADNLRNQGAMLAVGTKLSPTEAMNWRKGNFNQISGATKTLADNLAKQGAYGVTGLGGGRR